jgi:NitT/TauT family transport system substrate-binding protein
MPSVRVLLAVLYMAIVACAPAQPAQTATPTAQRAASGSAPAATAAAPVAVTPTAAPAPATVRLGLMYSASDAGLLVALERGYYRELGLNVELEQFGAAAQMLGPLGAAQIDTGGTAITPGYLNAFARGVRVRVVADKGTTEPGWGYQGIAIRRPLWDAGTVRGPAELRGRKVAIPSLGSSAEVGLDRGLRLGGIGVRDVDMTQLPFPDMPPALASGAIDGALIIEPFLTRVEADGTAVVWKREDEYYPNHQIALMYYSEPFATERADVARRFMVAYLRGVRDYNDGFRKGDAARRQEAVAALVKHTAVKDPALYERMAMPALHPDGEMHVDSLRENYEYWLANGYQEERVTVTDLIDSSFIRYAQQQLGPYR